MEEESTRGKEKREIVQNVERRSAFNPAKRFEIYPKVASDMRTKDRLIKQRKHLIKKDFFFFFLKYILLLSICRPFCIFDRCLESNPQSCRSMQAGAQPT